MSFESAHPSLQAALARRQYADPTPVQAAILAEPARDRDLLVSAQTGSGKTVAFGLAMAKQLLGDAARFEKAGAPVALVVTPTRELAQQVFRELAWLYADTGARITTCVGGFDPRREHHALQQGVHIVVGTPGRLCDHLERGSLVLARLQVAVLDEADEMLDMGFREDLERLLDAAPAERRTLLFSATIPKDIAAIAKRYQQKALRISTQAETDAHRDIAYHAVPIIPRERDLAVVNVLRYHEAAGALVFCNTRDGVTHLAANLGERGFSVVALSGELSQRERNVALQALRDGRARVCVATDVAARGLDLPDLGLVIHADLPQNKEVLVHRSGRTGRAGKHGVAIVLVPDNARRYVERTFHAAHIEAQWMRAPTAEQINERDAEVLVKEIGALAEQVEDDDREVAKKLLADRSAEDLVATLVAQQRSARPAPEMLTEPPSMRAGKSDSRRDGHGKPDARRGEHGKADSRRDWHGKGGTDGHGKADSRRDGHADTRRAGKTDSGRDWHGKGAHDGHGKAAGAGNSRLDGHSKVGRERPPFHRDANNAHGDDTHASHESDTNASHERGARGDTRTSHERGARGDTNPNERGARGDTNPNERGARGARGDRFVGPMTWFTINVGRSKNADPKWIVPLLCRRGGIDKRSIGKIQILQRETRVEIAADASERFAEAVRQPDVKDKHIHIEPLDEA